MMQIYTNEDAAIFMLENDLEKSKGRVVVSLPSSNLRETQGHFPDMMHQYCIWLDSVIGLRMNDDL